MRQVHIVAIVCVAVAVIALAVGLGIVFAVPGTMMSPVGAMTEAQKSALRLATTKKLKAEANRSRRGKKPADTPVETQTSPLAHGKHRVYETSANHRYIIRENSLCRSAKPIELKGATKATTLDRALNMAREQEDSNIAGVYRDLKNVWRGCALPISNGDATWPATKNGQRIYEFEQHLLQRKLRFNKLGYLESEKNIRKMRPNIDGTSFLYDNLAGEIEKAKWSLRHVPQADQIPWIA